MRNEERMKNAGLARRVQYGVDVLYLIKKESIYVNLDGVLVLWLFFPAKIPRD